MSEKFYYTPISISEDMFHDLRENYGGICTYCKGPVYGVEPELTDSKCPHCCKNTVCGIDIAVQNCLVTIS